MKIGNGIGIGSGSCVVAFSPDSIAGLELWLDASRITGLADGAAVTTWSDLSGNGNHATGAGSARPTFQTNEINTSKPVVRFDGANDMLALTSPIAVPNCTVYAVGNRANATKWIPLGGGAFGSMVAIYDNNQAYFIDSTGSFPSAVYTGSTGSIAARWRYVNGAAPTFAASGMASAAVSGTLSGNFDATHVGVRTAATEFGVGDFSEIMVFDSALSVDDMSLVEAYLAAKWGVTI